MQHISYIMMGTRHVDDGIVVSMIAAWSCDRASICVIKSGVGGRENMEPR